MLKTHPVLRIVNKTGAALERVRDDLAGLLDFRGDPVFMGHRMGEFRHYPENLNTTDRLGEYKEVTEMMDENFRFFGCTGLELDVRVASTPPEPGSDDTVFVVHDALKDDLPAPCLAYLQRNRLETVIKHFIRKKYYETKLLAIEFKLNKRWYDSRKGFLTAEHAYAERLTEATVATIERVCKELKLTKAVLRKVRRNIAFACFHLPALEHAHAAGGDDYRYYLIASTDRFWSGWINRLLWKNPALRGQQLERVAGCDWLTGVWFDPLFYDTPVATFNDLNLRADGRLTFFVATYYSGFDRLKDKLARERSQPPLPVTGLFFDLW